MEEDIIELMEEVNQEGLQMEIGCNANSMEIIEQKVVIPI